MPGLKAGKLRASGLRQARRRAAIMRAIASRCGPGGCTGWAPRVVRLVVVLVVQLVALRPGAPVVARAAGLATGAGCAARTAASSWAAATVTV